METFNDTRPAAELSSDNTELRYFGRKTDGVNCFNRAKESLGKPELPETLPYFGNTAGAYKTGSDASHFSGGTLDGRARYAKIWMFHALKHMNLADWRQPLTLDRRYNPPDGSYADFWCSDGEIWTYRLARGMPPMPQIGAIGPKGTGANTPHRTVVCGWCINGSPADEADFHVVTATDIANGHTAPEGKRVCRVFARDGQVFSWRDYIGYLPNGSVNGFADEDSSQVIEESLRPNTLVANIGQPATMEWMQVQPTELAPPAPGYAVPDLFRAKGAEFKSKKKNAITKRAPDGENIDDLHFEILFRPQGHGQRHQGIFSVGRDVRCFWKSDGTLGMIVGDVQIETKLPDYTPFHQFQAVQFTVNRLAGGTFQLLDGEDSVLAADTHPGEVSFLGQTRFFKDSNPNFDPLDAIVQYARLRVGSLTRAGAVTHAFEGDHGAPATTFSTGGVAVTGGSEFELTGKSGLLTPATL